jgi:GNAT superfamily N-acetyltransferase
MKNKYEIKLLTSKEAENFKTMTYGQYKPFLAWMDNVLGRLLPVGLFFEGEPAGLLLGLKLDAKDHMDILSLFIEKQHRGQKLSIEMMGFLEQRCREFEIANIKTFYFDNRPFVPLINKIFDKCGYGPVEPSVFFCKCDKSFANMPAIEYTDLPAGFETFRWSDLSRSHKEKLRNEWENKEWFDEVLSPFKAEGTIVSEISLGLKKNGDIVGWAICNYIENEKTILYTSIFIMPEHQGAALGIALQMRSVRGHLLTDLAEKYPYALFEVKYNNHARLKMVKKKFAKYAVEQYDQVIRTKCLL